MVEENKVLVMDIDGTICEVKPKEKTYLEILPKKDVVEKLREYRENGFYIILYTARQMRTYSGNLGKINANTAKVLFEWLELHNIPYDEIIFGKPWCGRAGFYVDDKAIRPSEFVNLSYEEILTLIGNEEK
ncbi:MAG: capsular biosynthesis protein [Cetobacterium sp.]|uniref:capsular biosynthesis protein n=1 Tax=Cetobacterium sp. TaxID=2071632 RepID=UPI003F400C2F